MNEAFDSEDWADDEPRVVNSKIKEGKESLDKNAAIKRFHPVVAFVDCDLT